MGNDGYYYKWNVETKTYEKTDVNLKGEKGDAFRYEDFTPEQVSALMAPATDAATEVARRLNDMATAEEQRETSVHNALEDIAEASGKAAAATDATNTAANAATTAANTAINSIMMYDCSAKGTITFATLDLAIAAVPLAYQKGGLHIKFVDTDSNKYNTYFLTTPTWSTSTADWQYSNENIEYAKNGTGVTVPKGKVVYINSSTGENPIFKLATNADYAIASRAWGVTMDSIKINDVGKIIHFGMIENIDTSAYTAGTELWLGINGEFTNVRPTLPTAQIYIGMVIRSSATEGSIFIDLRVAVGASIQDVYKKSNYNDGDNIIDFNTIHLITDNPEFICVAIDTDDKILYGIKADGQPYFGVGCPQQVKDYVNEQINKILGTDDITTTIDSLKEIEAFLKDFTNSDTLKKLFDLKANVDEVKATIDDIYKKSNPNDEEGNVVDTNTIVSVEDNSEYIKVITDNVGKLIESTDTKGNKTVYGNLNVKGDIYSSSISKQINDTIKNKVDKEEGKILVDENIADNFEEGENPEYVKILTDADNKIIDSIDDKGIVNHNSKHIFKAGIEDSTGKLVEDAYNHVLDKSSDLAKVLREKGDMVSSTDWSDSKSLEIPEPRCAYINITSSDGTAATWPTSKTANKKYWMQFWDMQGNYFKKRIILNAQGNSSMGFIKKNGAIDICNDEWEGDDTFKIKFGDWLAFDSFHLKAYYTDFFKGVSIMAYKLADEVEFSRDVLTNRPWKRQLLANYTFGTDQTNSAQVNDLSLQLDNEAKCHPDGFPCIVYLDSNFYGIYAFSIKKHRDNYHMDKGTAEHIHLDGDLYAANLWNGTINWAAFEIRNPKNLYYKEAHNGTYEYNADMAQAEIAGDDEVNAWIAAGKLPDGTNISSKIEKCLKITAKVKNYIVRLSNALATINNETDTVKQKTLFESYFDAPSLVDYEIVQLATGDTDGFGKNWQWITLDGVHWSVCEYDKDMSFGGFFTGQFTQASPSQGGWAGNSNSTPMGLAISLYKDDIVSMWKSLTDNKILTSDNIISIADDWVKRIGTDNFKKEYKKWDEAPCCRADLVDTEHWKRTNEYKFGISGNTYDNTKTYAIGDTCYYGFDNAYKFIAIAETTGNPPLTGSYNNYPKELGYYDSFWRLTNYIKQRISVENDFINSI